MNKYPFLPLPVVESILPIITQEQVSKRARSKGQFIEQYRRYNTNLPSKWISKRNNFIKRTVAQYNKHKTKRRKLALIAWAYNPGN